MGKAKQEEPKETADNLRQKRRPYRLLSEVVVIHDPEREREGLLATLDLGGDDGESGIIRACE